MLARFVEFRCNDIEIGAYEPVLMLWADKKLVTNDFNSIGEMKFLKPDLDVLIKEYHRVHVGLGDKKYYFYVSYEDACMAIPLLDAVIKMKSNAIERQLSEKIHQNIELKERIKTLERELMYLKNYFNL